MKNLPKVVHLDCCPRVIVAGARILHPPAVKHLAWRFVFRATKENAIVWFDWQLIPTAQTYAAAVLTLQRAAAGEVSLIEIVAGWPVKEK